MRSESIWKKFLLLTTAAIFVFNIHLASAADDTSTSTTDGGDEECVITDDLF